MNIEQGVTATKDLDLTINSVAEGENLASDKDIVTAVTDFISAIVNTNQGLLEGFWDDLIHYDYMFRCGLNQTEKASNTAIKTPEEPKANVGATMFFRQTMQSAAKLYSFMTSRDAYWKYRPVSTKGVPLSAEESENQANMLNTLIEWNLKQDNFDPKLMAICMAISKDGLAYVGVNWSRIREDRKIKIPGAVAEDGTVGESSVLDLKGILVENQAAITLYDPFSVIIDPNVGDIQKQACPTVTSVIPFSQAIQYVESGYWDEEQFRKIESNHGWDGQAGNPRKNETEENAGRTPASNKDSGLLLTWNSWANLPISESGELDQKKYIPRRYICTFVGNKISDAICVRIARNDDPDDKVPFEAIHDYPDTAPGMFHISKGRVLKNNFAVETTFVNMMIDGVSLVMQPPTIEKKGAVLSTVRKFGRNSRIVVRDDVNADMREYAVPDRTQTCIAGLGYVKDDSKMAIATDPAQMGEGLGARATATESSGVMRLSAAPSVMNAKFVTSQLFGYLGKRLKSFWQAFSTDEQVIRITDSSASISEIKPTEIYGDFDIVVDIVDQIVDDILSETKISQDIQALGSSQLLADKVNWDGLLDEYFIRRYGKSFVKDATDADAINQAQRDARSIMAGESPVAIEGQDHKSHLKVLRAEMVKYRGVEPEYAAQIEALKNLIAQHEEMMGAGAQGMAQPQQQAQPAQPPPEQLGAPQAAGGGGANMIPTPRV